MLQHDPEVYIGCVALSFDHEDRLEGSAFAGLDDRSWHERAVPTHTTNVG
jgi:hypothetical protein